MKATPTVTAEELLDRVDRSPALFERDLQDVGSLPVCRPSSQKVGHGRTPISMTDTS